MSHPNYPISNPKTPQGVPTQGAARRAPQWWPRSWSRAARRCWWPARAWAARCARLRGRAAWCACRRAARSAWPTRPPPPCAPRTAPARSRRSGWRASTRGAGCSGRGARPAGAAGAAGARRAPPGRSRARPGAAAARAAATRDGGGAGASRRRRMQRRTRRGTPRRPSRRRACRRAPSHLWGSVSAS